MLSYNHQQPLLYQWCSLTRVVSGAIESIGLTCNFAVTLTWVKPKNKRSDPKILRHFNGRVVLLGSASENSQVHWGLSIKNLTSATIRGNSWAYTDAWPMAQTQHTCWRINCWSLTFMIFTMVINHTVLRNCQFRMINHYSNYRL